MNMAEPLFEDRESVFYFLEYGNTGRNQIANRPDGRLGLDYRSEPLPYRPHFVGLRLFYGCSYRFHLPCVLRGDDSRNRHVKGS